MAIPSTAATVVVPLSVARAGLLASATVPFPLKLATLFPWASSARTFTVWLNWWPARRFSGCWRKASSVGAGGAVTSRAQVDSNKEATERAAARNGRAAIAPAAVEGCAMARSHRDVAGRCCAPLSPCDLAPLARAYVHGVAPGARSVGPTR